MTARLNLKQSDLKFYQTKKNGVTFTGDPLNTQHMNNTTTHIEHTLIKKGFRFMNALDNGSLVYRRTSGKFGFIWAEIQIEEGTINGMELDEFLKWFNEIK